MLAKRPIETSVFRSLISAFSTAEKADGNKQLNNADYVQIVRKQIKQREDSAEIYQTNGRMDLSRIEYAEIAVLEDYMPKAISEADIQLLLEAVILRTRLEVVKHNMGTLVKLVVADASGAADGKLVSTIVKKLIDSQQA